MALRGQVQVWLGLRPPISAVQHQNLEDHNPVDDEHERPVEPREDHFLLGRGTKGFEILLIVVE